MIDLHTHSTASDGGYTPTALIELAAQSGLSAIALTDHDTLAGLAGAREKAAQSGLRFVPGVEIEIQSDSGEFHLLGLLLDGDTGGLDKALGQVRGNRSARNRRMVEKMQASGIDISLEELGRLAGGEIISRAHFAQALIRKGVVSSVEQAFKQYLGRGRPFYERRDSLALSEAVSLIGKAGGVAVVAHPLSLDLKGPALEQFLKHCRDLGVAGMEAFHPNHRLKEARRLARMGRKLGLVLTGGSDFHGHYVPQRRLGRASGGREIPDELLAALEERRSRMRTG